jgi:hypothetical protein
MISRAVVQARLGWQEHTYLTAEIAVLSAQARTAAVAAVQIRRRFRSSATGFGSELRRVLFEVVAAEEVAEVAANTARRRP